VHIEETRQVHAFPRHDVNLVVGKSNGCMS
jgi:hypothetical protein